MPILGTGLGTCLGGALANGFNPLSTAPDVWLDAADESTISDTGTFTIAGKSSSGISGEQSTGADKPSTGVNTLNGKNVLTFDSDFLQLSSNQAFRTAIIVFNNVTAPVITGALFGSLSPNAGYYTFIDPSSSSYDISLDGSAGYTGEASINGGAFVSGTNIDLGRTPAENQGVNILVIRMDVTNYVDLIGAFGAGASTTVVGDIAEVFFWDRLITDAEVDYMVTGLTDKWFPTAVPEARSAGTSSGGTSAGDTQTANPDSFDFTQFPTGYLYQWERDPLGDGNWEVIVGAVSIAYLIAAAITDPIGSRLRCGVTPFNTLGSGTKVYTISITVTL